MSMIGGLAVTHQAPFTKIDSISPLLCPPEIPMVMRKVRLLFGHPQVNPTSDLGPTGSQRRVPPSMRLINSRMFQSLALGLLAALACLGCAASGSTDSALPAAKPRLVVLLVF